MSVRGTRCQGNAFLPIASPPLGSDVLRVRSGSSSSSCNGHILPSNAHQAAPGGGFQGVQFTVVACCIPSYFRGFFQGGLPGKKGLFHVPRPMHPQSIELATWSAFRGPQGGKPKWFGPARTKLVDPSRIPIIITETGGEAVMSRGAL